VTISSKKRFFHSSRLLAETGDSVELVDASDMVPGLKFRQGVSNWAVSDKAGNIYRNWSEVPEKVYSLIRPSMFPPPPEDAAKLNLVKLLKPNRVTMRKEFIYTYLVTILYT
jgi:hypothetical protein